MKAVQLKTGGKAERAVSLLLEAKRLRSELVGLLVDFAGDDQAENILNSSENWQSLNKIELAAQDLMNFVMDDELEKIVGTWNKQGNAREEGGDGDVYI